MKVACAVVLLALCPAFAFAQQNVTDSAVADPHEVQPERPTVATHAGTVAPGWIEVEVGGERDRFPGGAIGVSFPTNIKIGVAPRTQINLIASGINGTADDSHLRGLGDITIGLKYRLLENAPVVSDFAILASVKLPSAPSASGLGTGTTDVGLLLISSRSIGPADVDMNVGATRHFGGDPGAPTVSTLWTISAAMPLVGWLGWTGELYGIPGTSGPAGSERIIAVLTGPTFQPFKWLAVDFGLIDPVAGPQPRAFYAGFVWNIGKLF